MIVATKYSVHQIAPYKLLFSNAQTMKRKHSPKRNLMIHLSRDDGITWPIQPTIEYGSSAYSDSLFCRTEPYSIFTNPA